MKIGITQNFAPVHVHLTFDTQAELSTLKELLAIADEAEKRASGLGSSYGAISSVQQLARDLQKRIKEEVKL